MRDHSAKPPRRGGGRPGALSSPWLERAGLWLSLGAAALVLGLGFDLRGTRRTALVVQLERALGVELTEVRQDFERGLGSYGPALEDRGFGLAPQSALRSDPRPRLAPPFPALQEVERSWRRSGDHRRGMLELDLLTAGSLTPSMAAQAELARLRMVRGAWTLGPSDSTAQALAAQTERAWGELARVGFDSQAAQPQSEDEGLPWALAAGLFVLECWRDVDPARLAECADQLAQAWLAGPAAPEGRARLLDPAGGDPAGFAFDPLYLELTGRLVSLAPTVEGHLRAHRERLQARALWARLGATEPNHAALQREWWWLGQGHLALLTDERERLTLLAVADLERSLLRGRAGATAGGGRVRLDRREVLEAAAPPAPLPPPLATFGGRLALALEHPAPERLLGEALMPLRIQRIGALVLAGLLAFTGWASSRALGRARELAEARSLLVAGVSHELRTPVASILVLADNLNHPAARNSPRAERYPGLIRQEALRLKALVDDLLDLSRLERNQPIELDLKEVDLDALLSEFATDFDRLATEREFEFDVSFDLPAGLTIRADVESLRRALLNLLENALLHSGGGRVEFTARVLPDRSAVGLGVRDDGRGVPEREWRRLIQPFERGAPRSGHRATAGTGLGLAIAWGLAVAHEGALHWRAPVAVRGAWFELELPSVPAAPTIDAPQAARPEQERT